MDKLKSIKLHNCYYPVVLLSYVLALFFSVVRPGVVSAVLVSIVAVEAAIGLHKSRKEIAEGLHNINRTDPVGLHKLQTEDVVLFIWILYNILSGIWCVSFGMPVSVYVGELFTTAVPMCFYFCGRIDRKSGVFSDLYLIAVAVTGLLGIILFVTGPSFYIDYLQGGYPYNEGQDALGYRQYSYGISAICRNARICKGIYGFRG